MNSQVHYTTEIGRIRVDELRARAERYRLEEATKIRAQREHVPSRAASFVYRRALKIAALSVLVTGVGVIVN